MSARGDRRWPWWTQARDAIVLGVGIGIFASMAARNDWPLGGVLAGLVCVGALSASAAMQILAGRLERRNGNGKDQA